MSPKPYWKVRDKTRRGEGKKNFKLEKKKKSFRLRTYIDKYQHGNKKKKWLKTKKSSCEKRPENSIFFFFPPDVEIRRKDHRPSVLPPIPPVYFGSVGKLEFLEFLLRNLVILESFKT